MYKIIFGAILVISSFSVYAKDRLSMELEYKLLKECVGNTRYTKIKIESCACALSETIDGESLSWSGGYREDSDYYEDKKKFHKEFLSNMKKEKCINIK